MTAAEGMALLTCWRSGVGEARRLRPSTRRWAATASARALATSAVSSPFATSAAPPTKTQSMFDVSMPHTTAPIGSLTGAMLGRSARNTMTSARLPGLSEPVMAESPATLAPSMVA